MQRRTRALDEVSVENAPAVPHAAVEHELAELHEVARQDPHAAAAVGLTGEIDRPTVGPDLQRLAEQTIVRGQRRFAGRTAEHAESEIRIDAAIDALRAGLTVQRQAQRVTVVVGLVALIEHLVFVAGASGFVSSQK